MEKEWIIALIKRKFAEKYKQRKHVSIIKDLERQILWLINNAKG